MTLGGMLCFWPGARVRITIGKETDMVKKNGNAGSKKSSAATKAKRSAAKAQKTRAAKDAAAVKAVLRGQTRGRDRGR